MPASRARSTPPSPPCGNSALTRYLSPPIRSLPAGGSRSSRWRHVTPSRRCTQPRICRGGRADELWQRRSRRLSPRWTLRCADSQGREARRPPGRSGHQVRICDQSQDCEGSRPGRAARTNRRRRRGDRMKRREFITLFGSAAAWPLAARAQQPAMPVIGFLDAASAPERTDFMAAFRQGLAEAGYIEGQNVAIEYRWAEGRYDRLPELAADLVGRRVSVITTPATTDAALAAKAATATIPIVFGVGGDPVKLGLVESLNRPGGNATGVNFFTIELMAKRMQLLRELLPGAKHVAVLINPTDRSNESTLRDVETAATGLQVLAFEAATGREIDAAFENLEREKVDALFVAGGAFYSARRVQLAVLAARYAVPLRIR